MTGLTQFLEVFGSFTVASAVQIILAFVFLFFVYKKIKDYLIKKYEADKTRDAQLKEALAAVSKYPEYRQQSIEIQNKLETEIQELRKALNKNTKSIEQLKEDSKKREVNKLRDTLLQNYKYYTDKTKNPLQEWTRMESEAFCDLFGDYEDMGGDGYMHTVVMPAMQLLTVIEMNDTDKITELMQSRK